MSRLYARVIVDIAHSNVDRLFTYFVPEEISVEPGRRVLVPFGAGNKRVEGFVLELTETLEDTGLHVKNILKTLEPYSVVTEEQLELAAWMKASYHCLLVDALRLMIPAQLRGGGIKEKKIRTLAIPNGLDREKARTSLMKADGTPKAPKQLEVFELLCRVNSSMSAADIIAFVPNSSAAIRALCEKGFLQEDGHVVFRSPFEGKRIVPDEELPLTFAQQNAYESIALSLEQGDKTFLLHGVTGSGKTEVYMHAVKRVIGMGGTAIVLVPEIALTPQAMERFRSRFGERVALLHSRLSAGERFDEWRRIRLGKVDVVVGARSAVFAPLQNIKLIVVDEEHEPSYQSESVPRYNAIEVAAKRCKLQGAALVLGSATPSMHSYHRAINGRYTLLKLNERVNELPMPKVDIVDMRTEFLNGNNSILSALLHARLKECFEAGEQAILFMNRRGYSTFVSCRSCGYVVKCVDCDVSMTYHKADGLLKCHYCAKTSRVPKSCPECGKPYIKYFGIGTEQVEEQIRKYFPGVKTLRMDTDTTRTKNAHYELLNRFERGEAQALIGTQMVAKGLDMPNVTAVGVIAADATLHIPDFRSCERTFQLVTQVAGRAGRAQKPGTVVIQTYTPDHPAIQLAARHDYESFYQYEIAARRASMFPPFSVFLRALFTGEDERKPREACDAFALGAQEVILNAYRSQGANEKELLLLLSAAAPVKRKLAQYRYQTLIKLARTKNAAEAVNAVYTYANEHRDPSMSAIEVNPGDMF
ncbi:MAG TPA: primosomal protein N' [Clostridia bacterium]|nr:primosomal protein N' [Clostridia bacterium]